MSSIKLTDQKMEFEDAEITDTDLNGQPLGYIWFGSKHHYFGTLNLAGAKKLRDMCDRFIEQAQQISTNGDEK